MNLSAVPSTFARPICSASFPLIAAGRVVLAIWNSLHRRVAASRSTSVGARRVRRHSDGRSRFGEPQI